MADENTHENLTLTARREDDLGTYAVGLVLDGAFVLLQRVKIAHVEKAVSREQERAAQEKAAQAQQPEQQPEQPEQPPEPPPAY